MIVLGTTAASAATIKYEAIDIADDGSGDRWQYNYYVSDHTFAEREAFSILFDPSLYIALDPTPPGMTDWDILVLQPSAGLPSAGRYEPLALTAGASTAGMFSITFTWLGMGVPGSQQYELIQYDQNWDPTVTASGSTVAAAAGEVPEPSTWMLLSAGAGALTVLRRRNS